MQHYHHCMLQQTEEQTMCLRNYWWWGNPTNFHKIKCKNRNKNRWRGLYSYSSLGFLGFPRQTPEKSFQGKFRKSRWTMQIWRKKVLMLELSRFSWNQMFATPTRASDSSYIRGIAVLRSSSVTLESHCFHIQWEKTVRQHAALFVCRWLRVPVRRQSPSTQKPGGDLSFCWGEHAGASKNYYSPPTPQVCTLRVSTVSHTCRSFCLIHRFS